MSFFKKLADDFDKLAVDLTGGKKKDKEERTASPGRYLAPLPLPLLIVAR